MINRFSLITYEEELEVIISPADIVRRQKEVRVWLLQNETDITKYDNKQAKYFTIQKICI